MWLELFCILMYILTTLVNELILFIDTVISKSTLAGVSYSTKLAGIAVT